MRSEGYQLDYPISAAQSAADERASFIRRTYAHLAGAVLALIALEAVMWNALGEEGRLSLMRLMFGGSWSWLVVMLLFMGAGVLAQRWAASRASPAMQYMGLGLYVVAWAIMFLPLLTVAHYVQAGRGAGETNLIAQAGILTAAVFGGLTLAVFTTRKDFSFLGPVLCVGSLIALGVIVAGIAFGFTLGLFFMFAMVALISGSILYNTSNVMLHYPTDMHVAAALELLADVAMMFWYILQILLSMGNRN